MSRNERCAAGGGDIVLRAATANDPVGACASARSAAMECVVISASVTPLNVVRLRMGGPVKSRVKKNARTMKIEGKSVLPWPKARFLRGLV